MTDPTERNRLDAEESPYLEAHADNPVNWQPWDETAMEAAREEDKPIFLSIGYAACHWCHVMAEESFEDEDVAEILNEAFVPVKVDREERPDVDSIYMTICQQVTGRGGWPLSAWLTPDGRPFYVGTYFPKEPKRGQPGFIQLLRDISESWTDPEEREDMEDRADQWTDAVEGELEEVPDQPGDAPGSEAIERAAEAAVRGADRDHGGWGRGQKFPHPGRLHILMRNVARNGREEYREVLTETLDAMANGGLYDHVGGGFHRYTTDRDWTVPHFEKMLYDNAEIPRAFLAAYQLTGEETYWERASETLAFLNRELKHEDGGFYSTLDARSGALDADSDEREEGTFYVWTPDQIREALAGQTYEPDVSAETAADVVCDRYGVTERGNFEGSTVLTISASLEELAEEYEMSEADLRDTLYTAENRLYEVREERPRPPRDEKILASWNGLAISAFAAAGVVDGPDRAQAGAQALEFVHDHLWDGDDRLLQRRYKNGETKIDGYLEDYAFLGRGAFDLYQATGEVSALEFALELARAIEQRFWDADAGTLYFTQQDGESLIARPQEVSDQSTPSSAGVAAELLLSLDHFTDHDRFESIATRVVETHASKIESNPLQHASLTLTADRLASGSLELTMVADDPPQAWRETVSERYLPRSLLAWRPGDEEEFESWLSTLGAASAPPIWAERGLREGEPAVYACQSFTCSPPKSDFTAAISWATEQFE